MNKPERVLIVTGGMIDLDFLSDYIRTNNPDYIVGVDKGLDSLTKLNIKPQLIIGDFDSANENTKQLYKYNQDTILLNPMKDLTDTHAACLEVIKLSPYKVDMLGATGTRIDHLSGNIALLKLFLDEGIEASIIDKHNKITMIDKHYTAIKRNMHGKYISCIPFSDTVSGLSISGFCYDLKNATMIKADTIGISNELIGEEGHITVGQGYLLIMETGD